MMNRREFINLTSLAAVGTGMNFYGLSPSFASLGPATPYKSLQPSYRLYPDGRYDITAGSIKLLNCYPVIDEKQLTPLKIEKGTDNTGDYLRYFLGEGTVTLRFENNTDKIVLRSELTGFGTLPYWFKPLGYGLVTGPDRFYKQGFGFAGPSGVFPFPSATSRLEGDRLKEEAWSYDSYLVSGLLSETGETLAWTVNDNHRFLHRTTFFNRYHRFGLIDRHLQVNNVYVDAGFSTENIASDGTVELPGITFMAGQPPYETFRSLMKELAEANGVRKLKPPEYIWCSWYEYERDFNFDLLQSLIRGMKKMKDRVEVQAVQIDAGYCATGDWLEANDKWPGGIERAIKFISENGFTPGIWVGPFMVGGESRIYNEHPDWLLRDEEGKLLKENTNYVLDTSHPGAFEYLRHVFRTFYDYGVRYFKTDFMDWGYRDSTKVKRYTPGKTSAEYYNDVVKMIREEIRDDSFWLGCISPYQPLVGYADAVRVSNDVHPDWKRETTVNMFREMWYGQIFNNILWQNDPDVLYLRNENSSFTADEKYSVALYDGIMGGVVGTSDRFYTLDEASLHLWEMVKPGKTHNTAYPLDWDQPPVIFKLRRNLDKGLDAFFAVNISGDEATFQPGQYLLDGEADSFVYRYFPVQGFTLVSDPGKEELKLKPHESVLYYISDVKLKNPDSISLSGVKIS